MLILINSRFGTKPTFHLLHFANTLLSGGSISVVRGWNFLHRGDDLGGGGWVGGPFFLLSFGWMGKGRGVGKKGGELIRWVVELPTSDLVWEPFSRTLVSFIAFFYEAINKFVVAVVITCIVFSWNTYVHEYMDMDIFLRTMEFPRLWSWQSGASKISQTQRNPQNWRESQISYPHPLGYLHVMSR